MTYKSRAKDVNMPMSSAMYPVPGDECQCGRRASTRHCPQCGSGRYYGYSQDRFIEKADGTIVKVKQFRCTSCGHRYTDAEREFCEAPALGRKLAMQRVQALAHARREDAPMTPQENKLISAIEQVAGISLTDGWDDTKINKVLYKFRYSYADELYTARQSGLGDSFAKFPVWLEKKIATSGLPPTVVEIMVKRAREDEQ